MGRTARAVDEACELRRAGFDYFATVGDVQIFRKRKQFYMYKDNFI